MIMHVCWSRGWFLARFKNRSLANIDGNGCKTSIPREIQAGLEYALCGCKTFCGMKQVTLMGFHRAYSFNKCLLALIRVLLDEGFEKSEIELAIANIEVYSKLHSLDEEIWSEPPTWDIDSSFFFSVSLVTTIGYGNVSPKTAYGLLFCLLYILLGVPLNMIFIQNLAELHSERWQRLFHDPVFAAINSKFLRCLYLFQDTLYYLAVLIFIPSITLVYSEKWLFLEGLYYSFITLTTIGFGDYVAGDKLNPGFRTFVYKLCLFIWFLVGVSYFTMLFSYMAHYYTLHGTHALVWRNGQVSFVRIQFAMQGFNYHEVLYRSELIGPSISEESPSVPEYLGSYRHLEDLDSMINRLMRDRKVKLKELHKKRLLLRQWKNT